MKQVSTLFADCIFQNHRIAEGGRDIWVPLVQSCSSRDTPSRLTRAISRWLLKISKEETTTVSLFNFCTALYLSQHRNASECSKVICSVQVCSHCLSSWHWTQLRKTWLCLFHTLPSSVYRHWWDPLGLLFSRPNRSSSHRLSSQ